MQTKSNLLIQYCGVQVFVVERWLSLKHLLNSEQDKIQSQHRNVKRN
jgi:hypothetical protein